MEQNQARFGNWRAFYQLIRNTQPSKLKMGIAFLMSVATTLVGLVIPLFTGKLVDSFTLSTISIGQIVFLFAAFVAQAIAGGISIYLLHQAGQGIVDRGNDPRKFVLRGRRRRQ